VMPEGGVFMPKPYVPENVAKTIQGLLGGRL